MASRVDARRQKPMVFWPKTWLMAASRPAVYFYDWASTHAYLLWSPMSQ